MNKLTIFAVCISTCAVVFALLATHQSTPASAQTLKNVEVQFFRSETCGCCAGHAAALTKAGADVTIENLDEVSLQKLKEEYGVPFNKQSCHTALVDNYVVEGHVPVEVITDLLRKKPNTKGITLPGMPIGTPGMPGLQTAPFIIETLEGPIYSIIQHNPS